MDAPGLPTMDAVRILIADDHEALREGVRGVIEQNPGWSVCGTAVNGREALDLAQQLNPDVVILDLLMPELSGIELVRRIKRALPATEIVIFTGHFEEEVVRHAFQAGARGFILKSEPLTALVDAVRCAAEHKPFFTPKISDVFFSQLIGERQCDGKSPDDPLTDREREIIQLLCDGNSNKQVASTLGISVRTAEAHRAHVLKKLGIDSLADLVRYAIRHGLTRA